ncbi:MAG: hypothetical protein LUG60_00050 [Erysipelotrichaceae bacterium]|nr:hypothetical protein [Erysipelotrichaceae bacterium]
MSGPKISIYQLTPQLQKIVNEQFDFKGRMGIAIEKIKKEHEKILEIEQFNSDKDIASELMNRNGDDNEFSDKLNELNKIKNDANEIISQLNFKNIESQINAKVTINLIQVVNPISLIDVKTLEEKADVLSDQLSRGKIIAEELKTISVENKNLLKNQLQETIDEGFNTSFADFEIDKDTNISNPISGIITELNKLKDNIILSEEYKNEINKSLQKADEIKDITYLKNYGAITLKPMLNQRNQYIEDYQKYHDEFETLFNEYSVLCNLYGYIVQEYVCSKENIDILKNEIKRIKETAIKDTEQSYINDCLDEVMEEMGYSIIGSRSVTKRNGKHFHDELYTYGEGAAVNVRYSSDGQITMELGGIDDNDRLPDEYETEMLCESMNEFCEDFSEIEKRLLAKGVVLSNRISHLPPDGEHAQIINTSDYEMQYETEKLQAFKKQTTTKLKTMKED